MTLKEEGRPLQILAGVASAADAAILAPIGIQLNQFCPRLD